MQVYFLGHADPALLGNDTLIDIAQEYNKSVVQTILRWHLQEGFSAIPGFTNPDHIQKRIDVFDFELTGDDMARIRALDRGEGGRYFNIDYRTAGIFFMSLNEQRDVWGSSCWRSRTHSCGWTLTYRSRNRGLLASRGQDDLLEDFLQHAVVVGRLGLVVRHLVQAVAGVSDADASAGGLDHADVVSGVAHGYCVGEVDAQELCELLKACALVDVLGVELQVAPDLKVVEVPTLRSAGMPFSIHHSSSVLSEMQ
ncbi:MAG: aldo/keto reductase [Coriobacteriaceae bacterium]|nr:MAG: aldo/keto reductase [Coriobacteriaceae bacterium]